MWKRHGNAVPTHYCSATPLLAPSLWLRFMLQNRSLLELSICATIQFGCWHFRIRSKSSGSHENNQFACGLSMCNLGAESGRELFKGSKDSAILLVCTWKKFLGWVAFFCGWCHKWRTFRPPWPTLPGPGLKPLDGSISLRFLLGTRLRSKSFDTLDDLLGFRVQKLWSEPN